MIKKNSGQSLVEVLLALGIISLVLISLVSLTTSSISSTIYARNEQQASRYSQVAIENTRNHYLNSNWTDFSDSCPNSIWTEEITLAAGFNPLVITCNPLMVDSDGDGLTEDVGLKITVTASWNDNKGIHEVEVTDYFGNKTYEITP